jgi:hypothetical protein
VTDCAFLLEQLADGREHTLTDLLRASIEKRGHGLTVHSRVSDLRRQGHDIEHVTIPGAARGAGHAYRLMLAKPESTSSTVGLTDPAGTDGTDSGFASDQLFEIPAVRPGAYSEAA